MSPQAKKGKGQESSAALKRRIRTSAVSKFRVDRSESRGSFLMIGSMIPPSPFGTLRNGPRFYAYAAIPLLEVPEGGKRRTIVWSVIAKAANRSRRRRSRKALPALSCVRPRHALLRVFLRGCAFAVP